MIGCSWLLHIGKFVEIWYNIQASLAVVSTLQVWTSLQDTQEREKVVPEKRKKLYGVGGTQHSSDWATPSFRVRQCIRFRRVT